MVEEKEYLTKEKHEELIKELDHLKKTKRKEVADNLEYAKSMGDLSENAEYQEARELQATIEERINKLESILKSAVIMTAHHGAMADIGATVIVEKGADKKQITYKIVGSEESDISSGKISNHSPLGIALIGKKKGDAFTFTTPNGKTTYKIVDVK